MSACHRTAVLLLLATSLSRAQLTIENPKHLDVPEPQAQALFQTTTRVLESEFHSPGALENKFRIRLVLGEKPERFTIDDPLGNGTIYLERWNEGRFAVATMRLAVQHLLAPERQKRMLEEIVRRTNEIAPVSAAELHRERIDMPQPGPQSDCIARIPDAAVRGLPCRMGDEIRRPAPLSPF